MPDPTIPSQPTPPPSQADPALPSARDIFNTASIRLIIRNRKKVLFEDDINSLTSLNEKGVFDVLPQHENFISIIKKHLIINKKDGQKETIAIENGIIRVKSNQINCYIDLLALGSSAVPVSRPPTPPTKS